MNLFQVWIFPGVNIFEGWIYLWRIFFRGEYFSGVNIFLIWIFPSEDAHSLLGLVFPFFPFFFTQALWASPSAMKCEGPRHGKCFFYYRCDQSKIICWPTTTGQEIHKIFSLSICRYYPVKALWEVDIVTFNVNFPLILILLGS